MNDNEQQSTILKENQQLKKALENSILGIVVLDTSLFITFVNKHWADIHGYIQQELLKKSIDLFFERSDFEESVIPAIENTKTARFSTTQLEHLKKDNTKVFVYIRWQLLTDERDNHIGYVCSALDISKQKEHEIELKRKADELEKVNKLMLGRELKMVELKRKISELEKSINSKL